MPRKIGRTSRRSLRTQLARNTEDMGPITLDGGASLKAPPPDDEDAPDLLAATPSSPPCIRARLPDMADAIGAVVHPSGRAGIRALLFPNAPALIRKKRKMQRIKNFTHGANFQLWPPPASPR